ncbi:response regulator transcription factor [Campylobacter sp. 9BO]|uniref:response regulator transcription factor n=1 Tax=Campylobacter sp. 9BO TaxID=3424759 RepID=UPI003D358D7C
MNVVLCTNNNSLKNLWKSYKIKKLSNIVKTEAELLSEIKKNKEIIVGIDIGALSDPQKFIKEILATYSGARILILANEPNFAYGKLLLTYGVKGYANSHMQEIHFCDAIRAIADGNVWLYPEFIQQMIGELTGAAGTGVKNDILAELTPREKEVAELIYKGHTNQEISDLSGITLRTVKAHAVSIYAKAGVKDRVGLVLAMQQQDA